MNPVEVKILLLRKGLNFADMARELHLEDETNAKPESLEVMLSDLFYQRRWYPTLAKLVKKKYKISLKCPSHSVPIRQQIKQAA